jgi:ribosomal protein L30E
MTDKFEKSLVLGYRTEKEHKKTVKANKVIIARIALDHLEEDRNYYQKLAKMEKRKLSSAV